MTLAPKVKADTESRRHRQSDVAPSSVDHIVHTIGSLRLAGRENAVHVDVDMEATLGDGGLETHSELPILMSDYGIVPPSGMFGVIRCVDRVVVKFVLTLAPNVTATSVTALSLPH
jgi:hypothetical protein